MSYKKVTTQTYDQNANEFEEATQNLLHQHISQDILDFGSLTNGKLILDLGSGPGRDSVYFKSQGLQPVCLDISRAMARKCKEKGLPAIVADMEALPFPEETFNGIWAATSVLHLPKNNLPSTLNSIRRILKLKGALYISIKEGCGEKMITSDKYEGERFFAFYQPKEIEQKLEREFKIINGIRRTVGEATFLAYLCQKV